MKFSFHPEAEAEFQEAIDYYELHRLGLGRDFAVEIYAAIERILGFPQAWPGLEGDVRRCSTRRFPYGVLYAEHGGEILVVAIMHLHRDPEYWKPRLG
jgi:plasmid stabilization system protein ParE